MARKLAYSDVITSGSSYRQLNAIVEDFLLISLDQYSVECQNLVKCQNSPSGMKPCVCLSEVMKIHYTHS